MWDVRLFDLCTLVINALIIGLLSMRKILDRFHQKLPLIWIFTLIYFGAIYVKVRVKPFLQVAPDELSISGYSDISNFTT